MGKLGIFESDQIKWVQFDEDTEVQIRFIGKEELSALNRKSEKAARLSGGDDREIFNRLLAEKCVQGWRNIYDHNHTGLTMPNGDPIPFEDKSRGFLMKKSIEFSGFVNNTCTNSKLFLEEGDERVESKND